ncbi:MAG: PSP1 C-terminal domain-containing protein [Collinsella sp.]
MFDFRRLVEKNGLDMKPVGVEYLFGGEKAVFYFAAEDRVDFRQLVEDLSAHFHVAWTCARPACATRPACRAATPPAARSCAVPVSAGSLSPSPSAWPRSRTCR